MDIVESDYMNSRFPDRQEDEVEEYSACAGCGEVIFKDEESPLDVFGMCVHRDLNCMIKATSATEIDMNREE